MKKFFSLIFFAVLFLLMFVIGNYNNTPVMVHFLIVQTQWPLAAVMSLMLFIGFSFGLIAALIIGMKKSKQDNTNLKTNTSQAKDNSDEASDEFTADTKMLTTTSKS